MTAHDLPLVDPLRVRRITPRGAMDLVGGVLVLDTYDVEDVGPADSRLEFDEDVVDCSKRIFQITTLMMVEKRRGPLAFTVFPSRRWRNFRTAQHIEGLPDAEHPLLYLGNPVRLFADADGIHVIRIPEFLIKSGPELGF
jgi:hypothetical protein